MLPPFLFFGVRKSRRRVLYILFAYQIVIGVAAYTFNLSLYHFSILFMGVPAAVLAYFLHHERKLVYEALIFSIPAIILIDLVGHTSRSWNYWQSETTGIYFGEYPLIAFVWAFVYWMFIVAFYEYFYDHSSRKTIPIREKILIPILFGVCALFLYAIDGHFLYVPYHYAIILTISLVLNVILIKRYKYSFFRTYLPVIVLTLPFFLHEWISLALDYWSFVVGNHVMYFVVPGALHPLPLEELLWFLIVNYSVILIHETLADNGRF